MNKDDVFIIKIFREQQDRQILYKLKFSINDVETLEIVTVENHGPIGNVVKIPESFWKNIENNTVLGSKLGRLIHQFEKGEIVETPYYLGNLQDVYLPSNGN